MNISFKWLKNYADIDLSAEQVATLLTDIGLEVEGFEKFNELFAFLVADSPAETSVFSAICSTVKPEISLSSRIRAATSRILKSIPVMV